MKRGRHVEDVRPPSQRQRQGEACVERYQREGREAEQPICGHIELAPDPCCHGGHGRHVAIPRARVRWPSSSQAGLASFRSAR